MGLQLDVRCINRTLASLPYSVTSQEADGLREIFSMYMPRGPIRKLVTYFRAGGGMPLYVGHSEYYDFDQVVSAITERPSTSTGFRNSMFGGGKGYSIPAMFISGVAETFERALGAFAYFQQSDEIVYGSCRRLVNEGYPCLGPEDIPLFAEEQYCSGELLFERFREDSLLGWIRGRRLLSGEEVWAPCQLVLPYYPSHPDETLIGYGTTGGLACHISREEAIFHGVMELIERDSVNIHWNCRVAPQRIRIDRPSTLPALDRLMRVASTLPISFNYYLHCVDIPEVPVVTVIAFAPAFRRYSYYAGGGVALGIDEAMLYALTEYGQSEGTLRALLLAPDWELSKATRRLFDVPEDATVNDIDMFFKIVSYYGYTNNARRMDWYLRNGEGVPLSELSVGDTRSSAEQFAQLQDILGRHDIDPVIFDFTPPQMTTLRLTKALIPELAAPYLQRLPLLGHPRYYELPQRLGWSDRRLRFEDLTADPQPYP